MRRGWSEEKDEGLERKPPWMKMKIPAGAGYVRLKDLVARQSLNTVCQSATCPNIGECWAAGTLTIMILGGTCTRRCAFCDVPTGNPRGVVDSEEPRRVAEALSELGLKHAVVTSVDRDDLKDGGAAIWAETISEIRARCPGLTLETLTGDFGGDHAAQDLVFAARPDIFSHNLETVERLQSQVRSAARFDRSLEILRRASAAGLVAKSGIMLGLGESDEEVIAAMRALRANGASIVTLGQYLRPSKEHHPVTRWVSPDQFAALREEGLAMGFRVVDAGPLVRSSYHAERHVFDPATGPTE